MSAFQQSKPSVLKVILVGESGIGKSSIISRFCEENFNEYQQITLSSVFHSKKIQIPDSDSYITFNIWDTVGHEKYRSVTKMFFKDVQAIIFVYDITNEDSFNQVIDYWHKVSVEHCPEEIMLIVVGNKSDLENKRVISKEMGKNYAKKIDALFFEVSARSGQGIEKVFNKIAKKFGNKMNPLYEHEGESMTLDSTKPNKQSCGC